MSEKLAYDIIRELKIVNIEDYNLEIIDDETGQSPTYKAILNITYDSGKKCSLFVKGYDSSTGIIPFTMRILFYSHNADIQGVCYNEFAFLKCVTEMPETNPVKEKILPIYAIQEYGSVDAIKLSGCCHLFCDYRPNPSYSFFICMERIKESEFDQAKVLEPISKERYIKMVEFIGMFHSDLRNHNEFLGFTGSKAKEYFDCFAQPIHQSTIDNAHYRYRDLMKFEDSQYSNFSRNLDIDKLNKVFNKYSSDPGMQTLIHGDFHTANVAFHKSTDKFYVYDYQGARMDFFCIDIVSVLFSAPVELHEVIMLKYYDSCPWIQGVMRYEKCQDIILVGFVYKTLAALSVYVPRWLYNSSEKSDDPKTNFISRMMKFLLDLYSEIVRDGDGRYSRVLKKVNNGLL